MKIRVRLTGFLKKYFDGEEQRVLDFEDGISARQVVELIGVDFEKMGFVSINNLRVMIDDQLKDGDLLKVFPKIYGG